MYAAKMTDQIPLKAKSDPQFEWEDMTPAEQEEVRQNFEEEGKELEEEFSDDSFAQYILDKVEQAIEE
ncbi:hypothetical protein AALB47_00010 [Lachnospiraceae bacterium 54-11]